MLRELLEVCDPGELAEPDNLTEEQGDEHELESDVSVLRRLGGARLVDAPGVGVTPRTSPRPVFVSLTPSVDRLLDTRLLRYATALLTIPLSCP